MRWHLKILGAIFISLGIFIASFILFVLVSGLLMGLGLIRATPNQSLSSALIVFMVLVYPAIWIMQTGLALYYQKRSGRIVGIIVAAVFLIGLNVILLLTKYQPGRNSKGLLLFHVLMILVGVYAMIVLVPGRVGNYLEG